METGHCSSNMDDYRNDSSKAMENADEGENYILSDGANNGFPSEPSIDNDTTDAQKGASPMSSRYDTFNMPAGKGDKHTTDPSALNSESTCADKTIAVDPKVQDGVSGDLSSHPNASNGTGTTCGNQPSLSWQCFSSLLFVGGGAKNTQEGMAGIQPTVSRYASAFILARNFLILFIYFNSIRTWAHFLRHLLFHWY